MALIVLVIFSVSAVLVSMLTLDRAKTAARSDAGFTAKIAADAIEGELSVAQSSVSTAAASAGVIAALSQSPSECGVQFALSSFPEAHLDIVSRDGQVVCSSV